MSFIADNFHSGPMSGSSLEIVAALATPPKRHADHHLLALIDKFEREGSEIVAEAILATPAQTIVSIAAKLEIVAEGLKHSQGGWTEEMLDSAIEDAYTLMARGPSPAAREPIGECV